MTRRILFLASNPTDTGRLRLDKEAREIDESLKRSKERDRFDLVAKFAVRIEDLRRSMLDYSPRIVHFSGHGASGTGVCVEDDQGKASEVPIEALAGLFELCAGQIECVILNACYSGAQADAIAKHIPYVVGMGDTVSDDAALEFAIGFYDAVGAGRSVEEAFGFGRNAIALKGIPEHLIPALKKKELPPEERTRLQASYSPANGVFMDVSVMNEDASSWKRGENTILQYDARRSERGISIEGSMGFLTLFGTGGPITPMSYLSPTWCPFKWDFPILDFKILNNGAATLFLTEVVFDIEESLPDLAPFLAIRRDTQQAFAGNLLLVNEGWCDLTNVTVSFHLLPGKAVEVEGLPPYSHFVTLPLLEDRAKVDVTSAFLEEGVDIDGLSLLGNGEWEDRNTFVVPGIDGPGERISGPEMQERWKACLGRFQEEIGTLIGEISFATSVDAGHRRAVRFQAEVYLCNENRKGLPRPPTFMYDAALVARGDHYQRRVPISHTVQPGEADRFTIRLAVPQSSLHRFHATLRDIAGLALRSLPIEMSCFVPRSRRQAVQQLLARLPSK
jgi:hypothetical protein